MAPNWAKRVGINALVKRMQAKLDRSDPFSAHEVEHIASPHLEYRTFQKPRPLSGHKFEPKAGDDPRYLRCPAQSDRSLWTLVWPASRFRGICQRPPLRDDAPSSVLL